MFYIDLFDLLDKTCCVKAVVLFTAGLKAEQQQRPQAESTCKRRRPVLKYPSFSAFTDKHWAGCRLIGSHGRHHFLFFVFVFVLLTKRAWRQKSPGCDVMQVGKKAEMSRCRLRHAVDYGCHYPSLISRRVGLLKLCKLFLDVVGDLIYFTLFTFWPDTEMRFDFMRQVFFSFFFNHKIASGRAMVYLIYFVANLFTVQSLTNPDSPRIEQWKPKVSTSLKASGYTRKSFSLHD